MKKIECEHRDGGSLTINRECAAFLHANGLDTYAAFSRLLEGLGATSIKQGHSERTTLRFELSDGETSAAFYIKIHAPSPWKEYVKPYFRLTTPILGARNEWEALLRFHELDIPTMLPVALGELGRHSFLVTRSIDDCQKLSHWMEHHDPARGEQHADGVQQIIDDVAAIARRVHGAGMHHQDFYLTHLLLPEEWPERDIYVIDLGRVRSHRHLNRRWIVKDLAQLNYSADRFTKSQRLRFLKAYFGRRVSGDDRQFVRRILKKTDSIARHSRKNRL